MITRVDGGCSEFLRGGLLSFGARAAPRVPTDPSLPTASLSKRSISSDPRTVEINTSIWDARDAAGLRYIDRATFQTRLSAGVCTRRPFRKRKPPSTANQYIPKSLELEQWIARGEHQPREWSRRVSALDAQLDHLLARARLD